AFNNYDRGMRLQRIKGEYISENDMDQLKYTYEGSEAQVNLSEAMVKQAEANLKNSAANLGYTKIIAPEDGIVIERKIDEGQTVAASFQTPELFVIAPEMEEHMHVFASVDEADIGQIRRAQDN